jgi:hypothetical protein
VQACAPSAKDPCYITVLHDHEHAFRGLLTDLVSPFPLNLPLGLMGGKAEGIPFTGSIMYSRLNLDVLACALHALAAVPQVRAWAQARASLPQGGMCDALATVLRALDPRTGGTSAGQVILPLDLLRYWSARYPVGTGVTPRDAIEWITASCCADEPEHPAGAAASEPA